MSRCLKKTSVKLVERAHPRGVDRIRIRDHGFETVIGDLDDLVEGHAHFAQVRALNATPAISQELIRRIDARNTDDHRTIEAFAVGLAQDAKFFLLRRVKVTQQGGTGVHQSLLIGLVGQEEVNDIGVGGNQ